MAKFRCKICGHIYDEEIEKIKFSDLPDDWVCPTCGVPKYLFEEVQDVQQEIDDNLKKAVKISSNNQAIERDVKKCIDCGLCKYTCKIQEGMEFDQNSELCVNCGQCISTCPTNALKPKSDLSKLEEAFKNKICIAYTSPSVRVSIGDCFDKPSGSFEIEKLVGLLKQLGFQFVFDTTFAADLTIMEEASELVDRIQNKKTLPIITSCCPAWVKYAEQFYPDILNHISTCKSPIGMMGPVVKEYWANKNHFNKEDLFTVAITPCTAKKFEISRPEIIDTDLVITVRELIDFIQSKNIQYDDIKCCHYDSFEGSNSGTIFGNTGGVMEAALRTANYLVTGADLEEQVIFEDVRGFDNVKESTVKIGDLEIRIAVIHQMSSAKKILEDIQNGTSPYHFIEIMNCVGGCIGGGGQPLKDIHKVEEIKKDRIKSLYLMADKRPIRYSHHNPEIKKIYEEFLENPLSAISEKYLHTTYQNRK